MAYLTIPQVAAWLNLTDSHEHAALAVCAAAAEDAVASHCGQRFDVAASATRVFEPTDPYVLDLGPHPLTAVTTLKVDDDDDGTYETTWAATEYQLEPFNGVGDDGTTGHPYTRVRAIDVIFPTSANGRATVQIVGTFGWAAVPDAVQLASLMFAGWLWSNRAAPSGVQMTDFGAVAARKRPNVDNLLAPYRRNPVAVG